MYFEMARRKNEQFGVLDANASLTIDVLRGDEHVATTPAPKKSLRRIIFEKGILLIFSSSSRFLPGGFVSSLQYLPRQDRPIDTAFVSDIAFALLVGEHLTFSEQKMLLSLCSFSRPLPGPTVSLAVSPTQSWEPRGVLHRDEESPPRGRRSAFPRT